MIKTVSAIALALVALSRLPTLLRRPMRLWRATLDVCIICMCLAIPLMWEKGPSGGLILGIGFAQNTLGFALQNVAATSARIYSRSFRRPTTTLASCRDLIGWGLLFEVALLTGWLSSPLIEGQAPLGSYVGPDPLSVVVYKVGAWAWVIVSLLDVGVVSARAIPQTSRVSWPGLVLVSFAFFCAAGKLMGEIATIFPFAGKDWYVRCLESQPPTALTLAAGLALLFGLPWLRDRHKTRRSLQLLEPLWLCLTAQHPHLRLPLDDSTPEEVRLTRRVIEIRDALSLTPTRAHPGVTIEELAADLRQPPPPRGMAAADVLPQAVDVEDDIAQLEQLAMAFSYPHR